MNEGRVLSGLIPYRRHESNVDFDAYRIYMALLESLTPVWFTANRERLEFLNSEYTRRMEIAELRLRGYDLQADQLERQ